MYESVCTNSWSSAKVNLQEIIVSSDIKWDNEREPCQNVGYQCSNNKELEQFFAPPHSFKIFSTE